MSSDTVSLFSCLIGRHVPAADGEALKQITIEPKPLHRLGLFLGAGEGCHGWLGVLQQSFDDLISGRVSAVLAPVGGMPQRDPGRRVGETIGDTLGKVGLLTSAEVAPLPCLVPRPTSRDP